MVSIRGDTSKENFVFCCLLCPCLIVVFPLANTLHTCSKYEKIQDAKDTYGENKIHGAKRQIFIAENA